MDVRKFLSVNEIASLFEEDEFWKEMENAETIDVVVLPPDADVLSDNDEGDDDDTGEVEINDVPGTVELQIQGSDINITDAQHESQEEPINVDGVQKQTKIDPRWHKSQPNYNNVIKELEEESDKIKKMSEELHALTPVQLFEKFMSEDIFTLLKSETITYAQCAKNDNNFSVDIDDLKVFVGFLLLTGYHKLPSEKLYWSVDEDTGIELVKQAISRNSYLKIKSVLHLCDNANPDLSDRCYKIRPMITKINAAFQQWGVFSKYLSIDEMIVKYYGHNRLKQFIQSKPIRFGYKLWALCSSDGYCYKFSVYTGKEGNPSSGVTLGSKVVTTLLQAVENPNNHVVFFDNFFTDRNLLIHLKSLGFRATGTMRENRTSKCPLTDTKQLSKQDRGSFDFRFDKNGEILIVKWNDNKCVTMGTNYDTIEPLGKATRWSKAKKEKIVIPQPNVVKSYNGHMGGVDHHDWLVGKYAISIRGKKWYWPLITRMIDMCITNAWILYRKLHGSESVSCLDFRRSVATYYLKLGYRGQKRKYQLHSVVPDVRYDGREHWIKRRENQRRCQYINCNKKPLTYCTKCNVTLCVECFQPYHSQ